MCGATNPLYPPTCLTDLPEQLLSECEGLQPTSVKKFPGSLQPPVNYLLGIKALSLVPSLRGREYTTFIDARGSKGMTKVKIKWCLQSC